jgi:translation initiation factor IF-1
LHGNGHEVLARIGGRLMLHKVVVLPSDLLVVEVSPCDERRGRIIYRFG